MSYLKVLTKIRCLAIWSFLASTTCNMDEVSCCSWLPMALFLMFSSAVISISRMPTKFSYVYFATPAIIELIFGLAAVFIVVASNVTKTAESFVTGVLLHDQPSQNAIWWARSANPNYVTADSVDQNFVYITDEVIVDLGSLANFSNICTYSLGVSWHWSAHVHWELCPHLAQLGDILVLCQLWRQTPHSGRPRAVTTIFNTF